MLAIEVEYLTGRAVATAADDRDATEWPPHPARLAYALVAVAGDERSEAERRALDWLCALPPPAISCAEAARRDVVTAFVPVNDDRSLPKPDRVAAGALPRVRQPRTFPSATPERSRVTFIWDSADPDPYRDALSSLLGRVVYLGHSSSLVRAALVDAPPLPTLAPTAGGRTRSRLRVPAEGLVEALDDAYRLAARGIRGPLPCGWAAYGDVGAPPPQPVVRSVFGDPVVLRRVGGQPLPLAAAERVALALRKAVLALVPDPVPPEVSGHEADASPLARPHTAFVPLPDVGHPNARGRLLGVAAIPPEPLDGHARSTLLHALGRLQTLAFGDGLVWRLEPANYLRPDRRPPIGLLVPTWTRESQRWATATPLELDRFVEDRLGAEAEAVVARSVEHVGLPAPSRVRLTPVSALEGGGHWRDVRRASRPGQRLLVHAVLDFEKPVCGPLLVGAGRYRGLGLLRPFDAR